MIRSENGGWTQEAIEFSEDVTRTLKLIFNKYKDKFNFEEIFYIVVTAIERRILREAIDLKRNKQED